jgi:hypothetical protein
MNKIIPQVGAGLAGLFEPKTVRTYRDIKAAYVRNADGPARGHHYFNAAGMARRIAECVGPKYAGITLGKTSSPYQLKDRLNACTVSLAAAGNVFEHPQWKQFMASVNGGTNSGPQRANDADKDAGARRISNERAKFDALLSRGKG